MLKRMWIIAAAGFFAAQFPAAASSGNGLGTPSGSGSFRPIAERIGVAVHHPKEGDWPKVRALGLHIVRIDMTWQGIELTPGSYDFGPYLRMAAVVHHEGLRPLFILAYGNSLYSPLAAVPFYSNILVRPAGPATPTAVEAFGRWAQAAATTFAPYNPIFEIWNEPDVDHFWLPRPNPQDYATLAASACRHIRSVDPNAEVIGAALGALPKQGGPGGYLAQALSNPGMSCLDEISVHAYKNPGHVGRDIPNWRLMRGIVDARLRGKGIAVTEWGLPTSHPGDEQVQASYLVRSLVLALSQGVRTLVWYEYKDEVTGLKNDQDHYGLVHPDGKFKPAASAIKYFMNTIGPLDFYCGTVKNNTFMAEFRDRSSKVAAIIFWNESGAPSVKSPPLGAIFTDSLGNRAKASTFSESNADNPVYMLPASGSSLRPVCSAI